MRIGIDCRKIFDPIKNKGAGVERYVFNLVKNLLEVDNKNDYILFLSKKYPDKAMESLIGKNEKVKIVKVKERGVPFLTNHLLFSYKLYRENLNLTLFLANVIPLGYGRSSYLFIHDLIIYKHPEWFPAGQFFSKKLAVPRSVRKANKIMAISQSTKKDIQKIFKIPNKKIEVIYPSVDIISKVDEKEEQEIKEKFNLQKKYLLFVGTLEPRKNLINLFKAFKEILDEFPDVYLYIAGRVGWNYEKIFMAAKKAKLKTNIKYLGAVNNKEKVVLMKNCRIFTFLSLDEGFGMPVLEAMKVGVPVITSGRGGLGELITDKRQIANPADADDIAEKIKNLLLDHEMRKNIVEKQRKWADNFSWRISSQKLLKIIKGE